MPGNSKHGLNEVIELVRRYKNLLKEEIDFDKVYLFGSYAKGNYTQDSDIDVAIVVNQLDDDFFKTTPILWKLRRQIDIRIEPVLIENKNDFSGFLGEIQKYGIEVN
ncbi:MAG: nucleotidyltransferase domain-containing protein [Candidatus Kapabacteria bacterium]|nr:nucleotidyltransferase domain-containing protein [Ignavibacteriota bacterium]MCW5883812.1 nucleotidyltransferase domain-containing protein [Candidatus Kapabacteria bacterium]